MKLSQINILKMMRYIRAPSCGRCSKPVYLAEARLAVGLSWHVTNCFTCKNCDQILHSTTLTEHKQTKEIYCKSCYAKTFGPKGHGYGTGAWALSMDTGSMEGATNTVPSNEVQSTCTYIGGSKCGRCGGSVYQAEKRIGAGLLWHNTCFTCKACNKRLDSVTAHENINEKDIFCHMCYNKLCGPNGHDYRQVLMP